ncbi:MAG: hypothetical protein R3A80_12210 [Bdellovibrionota bacterium]
MQRRSAGASIGRIFKSSARGKSKLQGLRKGFRKRLVQLKEASGPHLFGEAVYAEDKKESDSPAQPSDVRATEYTLGIQEQFSFGLGAKFSYKQGKYDLIGANPAFLLASAAHFYRSTPQLELNFPVLKIF